MMEQTEINHAQGYGRSVGNSESFGAAGGWRQAVRGLAQAPVFEKGPETAQAIRQLPPPAEGRQTHGAAADGHVNEELEGV